MSTHNSFLFEIGCEEIPAKLLTRLADELLTNVKKQLDEKQLSFKSARYFATPRRIAIFIEDLIAKQNDYVIEKKGPSKQHAFDADGNPTKALQGFANACGAEINALETTEQGFLIFKKSVAGENTVNLLAEIIETSVCALNIPKPMRWGNHEKAFIRPVHWLVALYGNTIIPLQLFDLTASAVTYGHRFLNPEEIQLYHADDYENALLKAHVIASVATRKNAIQQQVDELAKNVQGYVEVDEDLLNEITGIVEWPVALLGAFDETFLQVPAECLMTSMKTHQKTFAVFNQEKQITRYFIFVANTISNDVKEVIHGNERVIQARLSDAKFFYESDRSQNLFSRLNMLEHIIFQAKLGTLHERSIRISLLAKYIANQLDLPEAFSERAGLLCKTDLVTEMVKEFPELQGIMGGYYAINDGEPEEVATAILQHYQPRFAKDNLPKTKIGSVVAMAEKIDTLVGIFGIGLIPTGEKDPYALRRAALGLLRLIIENQFDLDLNLLLKKSFSLYQDQHKLTTSDFLIPLHGFILERLKSWYQDQNIANDTLQAVLASEKGANNLLDIHQRVLAVHHFRNSLEAKSLNAANKRAANILQKSAKVSENSWKTIQSELFEENVETILWQQLSTLYETTNGLDYPETLKHLAKLQKPLDDFFEKVMVMSENENVKQNRLNLLSNVRYLFLNIADVSKLQD